MFIRFLTISIALAGWLHGGTVIISNLPDEQHPLEPLTSRAGNPLETGTVIRIGAFPGMSDDDLLDVAAEGGYAGISAAFEPFGSPAAIGEGSDATDGRFEISIRELLSELESPLINEEISLMILKNGGLEFLVARFDGEAFARDTESALEQIVALHLADARIVVGNRYGDTRILTSPPSSIGSFAQWLTGFPSITDPLKMTPEADADGDGRSNFLEYATGGNPASGSDHSPSQLSQDGSGDYWFHFKSEPGLGVIRYQALTSDDLSGPWLPLEGAAESNIQLPASGTAEWMMVPIPQAMGDEARRFFRLQVD